MSLIVLLVVIVIKYDLAACPSLLLFKEQFHLVHSTWTTTFSKGATPLTRLRGDLLD
jgi:hypothetical protein